MVIPLVVVMKPPYKKKKKALLMEVLIKTVSLIHYCQNVPLIMGSVLTVSSRTRTVTASLNMINALKVIMVTKMMRQLDVFQILRHVSLAT